MDVASLVLIVFLVVALLSAVLFGPMTARERALDVLPDESVTALAPAELEMAGARRELDALRRRVDTLETSVTLLVDLARETRAKVGDVEQVLGEVLDHLRRGAR